MPWSKEDIERRVLGVLIEKSLAQAEYYPMTLNALVTACNQKQNRDPVMELGEDEVYHALEELRLRGVVTVLLPGVGARIKRYRHEAGTYFHWGRSQQAVMAELLLRGPQTVGELRGRCSRMTPFETLEAVTAVLDALAGFDPPCVSALSREPGRSAIRHAQRIYAEPDPPAVTVSAAAAPAAPALATRNAQTEIEELRRQLAELQEQVTDVQRRLASIESQLL